MKMFQYDQVTKELMDNGAITGDDVYDISLYENPEVFSRFFDFCQRNLSEVCVERGYNIEPSRMYFTNKLAVNAAAAHGKLYYVIKINMGAVHSLFDLFCNNDILDDPELVDYRLFDKILIEDRQISLDFLMLQSATSFTYFHELGHLIQFSNQGGVKAMLTEQYSVDEKSLFEPLKHILEFDSDQHAANNVAFHVLNLWELMDKKNQTEENLKKLIVISLVGILGYIFFLWRSFNMDLYYDKYDHPHPLIRIVWIMLTLVETIKMKFSSIQQKEMIEETFRVLDVYFRLKQNGSIEEKFVEPFLKEYPSIMAYCSEVIEAAKQIPYLAVNTVHKK